MSTELPDFTTAPAWMDALGGVVAQRQVITRNIVAPALQPLVSPKEGLAAAEGTPGRVRPSEALLGRAGGVWTARRLVVDIAAAIVQTGCH